ncbi:MAG: hypothetical protein AVDCRST_MAG24-1773, partial [uncultured Nocardioidaceae bacterium]
ERAGDSRGRSAGDARGGARSRARVRRPRWPGLGERRPGGRRPAPDRLRHPPGTARPAQRTSGRAGRGTRGGRSGVRRAGVEQGRPPAAGGRDDDRGAVRGGLRPAGGRHQRRGAPVGGGGAARRRAALAHAGRRPVAVARAPRAL